MRLQSFHDGFILPATIALGLAVSLISVTFTQYVIASSETLNNQTYNGLAQEAASSGITYAMSCFSAGVRTWTALAPNTTCSGSDNGSAKYMAIAPDGSWRSTFTVSTPANPIGNTKITSTGIIEIMSGSAVINTISLIKDVTMSSNVGTAPSPTGEVLTDLSTDSHSCTIANGKLYCWGLNNSGQLGVGNAGDCQAGQSGPGPYNCASPQLVAATNASDAFYEKVITAIAVGTSNTCAVANSQLYCWGDNTYGQLGNGTIGGPPQDTPQLVTALSTRKITSLSLSQSTPNSKSACAVADGIVYCWGANTNQQLGRTITTANTTTLPTPTAIYGYQAGETGSPLYGKKVQSASVGAHNACATAWGKMYCWGNISSPSTPAAVRDYSSIGRYSSAPPVLPLSVKVTGDLSCSITDFLTCHGASPYGSPSSPTRTGDDYAAIDYDAGERTTGGDGFYCTINADVYCNGGSNVGNGGAGTITGSNDTETRSQTKVGVGNQYGCMISNGNLACWGTAAQGQLADGNLTSTSSRPKVVANNVIGNDNMRLGSYPRLATQNISAGTNHACATANGAIFCWGRNDRGQLGLGDASTIGQTQNQPTAIDVTQFPKLFGFFPINMRKEKITAGGDHSCAILSVGSTFGVDNSELYCWGGNTYGELGHGNTTDYSRPNKVSLSGTRITEVSAGPRNTCAVSDSQLYCWGDRSYGLIGDGINSGNQQTPKLIAAFAGKQVSSVSVGTYHACAIVNGDGYCWGANYECSIAPPISPSTCANDPGTAPIVLPSSGQITTGIASAITGNITAAFTGISTGNGFTCAIINGVAGCWGKSNKGQTGTGSTGTVQSPMLINGAPGTMQATAIAAGDTHACATIHGAIYCWGDQDNGRLGNGITTTGNPPLSTPMLISTGSAAGRTTTNVVAGDKTNCSISNGAILCWGAGTFGQVGNGSFSDSGLPSEATWFRSPGEVTIGQTY